MASSMKRIFALCILPNSNVKPLCDQKNEVYLNSNCFEITVEMSCCKVDECFQSELNKKWSDNKDSMVRYLLKVHQGLKGHIKDLNNILLSGAKIIVEDIR